MTKRRSKAVPRVPSSRRGFEIVGKVEEDETFIEVEIGGQKVKVYKMNVGSLQALVRLTEPYIKRAVAALVSQTGLDRLGERETVREALRRIIADQLSEMVVTVPETVMAACACLMNIRPVDEALMEWFITSALPKEVLDLLPLLDELNDFGQLWDDAMGLWGHFDKKYNIGALVQEQVSNPPAHAVTD